MTLEAIVGRDDELAALDAWLDDVRDASTAVVIEGEAGIGKTTTWRATVERAAERGWRVVTSRPSETETKLSFAVLGDLLADALDDVLPHLPEPQRRALDVALLRESAGGVPLDRRAVAVATLGAIRVLAASAPLVVAIDDVQWIDPPSAAALSFAVRRLDQEPVGLIVAVRAGRPDRVPLAWLLREERMRHIQLGPLSLGALHHLLTTKLRHTFPRPLLLRIHETSKGNPLFALELARALTATGAHVDLAAPLPVPEDVRALVAARLRDVPPRERDALLVAASLPDPTVSLVRRVSKARLDVARESGIVELDGDRIYFVHPLFASAVYANADAERRRRVHRRLAALADSPEARARHLALSTAAPDGEIAGVVEDAATEARTRGAVDTAAELGERAVALTPASTSDDLFVTRSITAAGYSLEAGDTARARRLLERAIERVPAGEARSAALVQLARVRSLESDLRAAAALFRDVLSERPDDRATIIDAHKGLATTLFRLRQDLVEAEHHAEVASRLAEKLRDPIKLADALSVHGMVACICGNPGARSILDRALVLAPETRPLGILAQPEFHDGVARMWTDDFATADATFRELRRRADDVGDESALPYLFAFLAFTAFVRGELETADRHVREGIDAATQAGQDVQTAFLLSTRALVEAQRGRADAARKDAASAREIGERTGAAIAGIQAAWALGSLALAEGDASEACAILAPLADRLLASGVGEPGTMRFVPDLIEALIAVGRLEEAGRRLTLLADQADRLDRPSARAAAGRCRALLHAAKGEIEPAFVAFEAACGAHEAVDLPFERARTLLALGSAARRAKRKRDARESIDEARAIFESVGAAIWAEAARTELSRIGGRSPAGDALTASERRVAALVAEGRTNREVAAALFVSDRTVEFHLSRIYAKLGVRSRAELARTFRVDAPPASAVLR